MGHRKSHKRKIMRNLNAHNLSHRYLLPLLERPHALHYEHPQKHEEQEQERHGQHAQRRRLIEVYTTKIVH